METKGGKTVMNKNKFSLVAEIRCNTVRSVWLLQKRHLKTETATADPQPSTH